MFKAAFYVALLCSAMAARADQTNWSGPYQACDNRSELFKTGHMDLGIRIDTKNPDIAAAFRRAVAFWSSVLDMSYREDASSACALALVDGTPALLNEAQTVARAQFTDLPNFQGWIAFDAHASEYMSADEIYATAVHELGHIFGLRHNPRASSVMYYLDCDGTSQLDETDLQALATRHAVRPGHRKSIPVLQQVLAKK
ncbi:MAG: matrixin family metalloprotease [Acidobacteriaceae bacterium]|nr:matrixin family metalloprotease [Acidobacteriaceae bacterium]